MTWKEAYTYDAAARPSSIATTITEGAAVTLNSAMSYDANGRPDTHTYPDGLVVRTLYGPYGQSGGQADGSAGTIWYEITAMDAWNKITAESFMDGTVGTFADYQSSGQQHTASWTLNGTTVDSLTYAYDSLGNLVSQYRVAGNQSNTETYVYDQLQRLTNASRTGGSVSYAYSASGNLTSKSDFGSYSYAGANSHNGNCGPHATYAAGGFTYACDANGNVYGGSTLSIAYDADNHPRTVVRANSGNAVSTFGVKTNLIGYANGNQVTWAYDTNGQRDYESTTRGIRYFAPGGYEQVGAQGIHELGPIVVTRTNGVDTITTELRDRLGSTIDTIDGGVANANNTRTYDAFGAVREGNMANRAGGTLNLNDTIHGFTQHEHADDVRLIHMGGRIYDYSLGRFLSVDPIIGNPLSSQSLNPYSYVGNNPLSGTDPTGYMQCTGSHVEHDSCEGPTFTSIHVGSPSVSERNDAIAAHLSAQADRVATTVESSGSNGATPGQSANSVKTADAANAGNPTTDPSSRLQGNAANGGYNGAPNSNIRPSTFDSKSYEGHPGDDQYEHADNDEERKGFASANTTTIAKAIGDLTKYFPQLRPYLQLSDTPYYNSDGSWHWNGKSIDVNAMALIGEIRLTSEGAAALAAHEALHGWVFSVDPNYTRHAWMGAFKTGFSSPWGGAPHQWIQNLGERIGSWTTAEDRVKLLVARPEISSANYYHCIEGGSCR